MSGTLLGWDVTVRFVPAGYVFDYGDGVVRALPDGRGELAEPRPGAVHPDRDEPRLPRARHVPCEVTVQYAASVDFGSGNWRPVTGYVTAGSGGYDVRVVEARTALVDQTCAENPRRSGLLSPTTRSSACAAASRPRRTAGRS